jgi:hypothetical protein
MRKSTLTYSLITLAILALAACATRDESRFADAATAPLSDLNLMRADIPPLLEEARQHPYLVPADSSCAALTTDIAALDLILGPDLDAPSTNDNPSLIERGSDEATNAAVGALRSTTESVIPFRGWVRRLTGADRYSKKVAASVTAGSIRRAFLKGIKITKACEAPLVR